MATKPFSCLTVVIQRYPLHLRENFLSSSQRFCLMMVEHLEITIRHCMSVNIQHDVWKNMGSD